MKYVEKAAAVSDCGRYRRLLRRVWDRDRPRVLYAMLNPSTADALDDDPTIRSCVRLADANGFGGMEVVNLYDLRATYPDELFSAAVRCTQANPHAIAAASGRCDLAVVAWGSHRSVTGHDVDRLLDALGRRLVYCLGTTKSGAPKHPLYLKTGTPYTVWRGRPVMAAAASPAGGLDR